MPTSPSAGSQSPAEDMKGLFRTVGLAVDMYKDMCGRTCRREIVRPWIAPRMRGSTMRPATSAGPWAKVCMLQATSQRQLRFLQQAHPTRSLARRVHNQARHPGVVGRQSEAIDRYSRTTSRQQQKGVKFYKTPDACCWQLSLGQDRCSQERGEPASRRC
jgi:hypothetical protein